MNVALPATAQTPAAQERARQIIDAASEVMSRKGYDGTSMKDIATEAGIAQGLIHYYFGSKEDLLVAVVRSMNEKMLGDIKDAIGEVTGDPLMHLWNSLNLIRDKYAVNADNCRLFFDLVTLSFRNDKLQKEVASLYEELTADATELVHQVAALMPTPLPLPEEEWAAILLASIDGVLLRNSLEPDYGRDRLFRSLAFLWISSAATSYWMAGETPPSEVFEKMIEDTAAAAAPQTTQGAPPD